MIRSDKRVRVIYKSDTVGSLALTGNRLAAFQYESAWLKNGFSISPFSLPLKESPAYDLTQCSTAFGEHTTLVNGKGTGILIDDLITVGCGGGLKKGFCEAVANQIYDEIQSLNSDYTNH